MKYWEYHRQQSQQSRLELGLVATVDSRGRTIFVADAHGDDGKRFVVRTDEKLTAFVELESAIRARPAVGWSTWVAAFDDNSFCNEITAFLTFAVCPEGRRLTIFRVH